MTKIVHAVLMLYLLVWPGVVCADDFQAIYTLQALSIDLLINRLKKGGASDPDEIQSLLQERMQIEKRIRAYKKYLPLRRSVRTPADEVMRIANHKAEYYGVEPKFILAMIKNESGFDPMALSRVGAIGIMQLMPETARELGVDDPWDPEQNIDAGVRYIRQQLQDFRDVRLALAAYNWGPYNVRKSDGEKFPKETRDYIQRVISDYNRYSRKSQE